jgi:hypothetical protein
MKPEWVSEAHTIFCTRNERSGFAQFKADTWKMRGMRKDFEKGICTVCGGEEGAVHT